MFHFIVKLKSLKNPQIAIPTEIPIGISLRPIGELVIKRSNPEKTVEFYQDQYLAVNPNQWFKEGVVV